jgi:Tfp pilus assembly protein PilF
MEVLLDNPITGQPTPAGAMPPSAERWTTIGLLDHFLHVNREMLDRAFAFVLGAGASKSSGIPTGAELAHQWLGELHRQLDPEHGTRPLQDWATAEYLGIPGFDFQRAAEFYPQVFQRRFGRDVEQGYAALEHAMKDAEPGVGYSVLATVLARERHRVVITPNFDNLVVDALAIFAHTHPLLVGHESLAHFARPRLRRPLVAKVHRDLFLAPKNTPGDLLALPDSGADALRALFEHYTPIVIGYGGNDGSLMGLLKSIEPGKIVGGILWCYRELDGPLRQDIVDVVARHSGILVPILGFDELMLQLNERLAYPLLADTIEKQARKRRELYVRSVEAIRIRLSIPAQDPSVEAARIQVSQVLMLTMQNDWARKADQEPDPDKREELYRAGIERFPMSTQLFNNGALFLEKRGKYDEAESFYWKAFELGLHPQTPKLMTNFASLLWRVQMNYEEAKRIYRLALDTHPNYPRATMNFAAFLLARGRFAEAADQARKTLALCGMPVNAYLRHFVAESLLYLGLVNRIDRTEDSAELEKLKSQLRTGFPRYPRPFDNILKAALERLQDEDRQLYAALADAVLDGKRVRDLDMHSRWKALPAVPPAP